MRLVAVLLFDTRCQCVRVQGPKRRSTCTNNQETAARCAVYLAANACSPACLCLIRTRVVQSRFTNPDAVRSPFAGTSLPVSVSTSLPQVASLTNRRNVVAAVRLLCGCGAVAELVLLDWSREELQSPGGRRRRSSTIYPVLRGLNIRGKCRLDAARLQL